ncbi:MAG: class I SAM-dependent methyltransferase, partial [Myxococcales bacterium]|nr:class I SAM-dependent methyltransferase [Myxococcales bacterium]
MEQDLVDKLHAFYGTDLTPVTRKHLDFALSNRKRGRKVIDRVVKVTGMDLRGKRVLDVGSAYGGFVIEAAASGADAWGVEISGRLHEYGRLNAQGEAGQIHQLHADFLSRRVLAELPHDFDLVLVNDVFEHVYDTAALLKQLHALMRPGAPFMFSIPNGDCVTAVAREGHNLTPGISLLAPNWWHHAVEEFTAFYHPWSYYSGLFRAFGFDRIDTWGGPKRALDDTRAEIRAGLATARDAVATLELDPAARATMRDTLAEYEARLDADLATGDADYLRWRYLNTFWKGCAYKGGAIFADVAEKPRRSARNTVVNAVGDLRPASVARRVRQVA